MIVWSYLVPEGAGRRVRRYGFPVTVAIPGCGMIQVVYQFPGGGQPWAVVDVPSGQTLAPIHDRHCHLAPQQTAQTAIDEHTAGADPDRLRGWLADLAVVNPIARVERWQ